MRSEGYFNKTSLTRLSDISALKLCFVLCFACGEPSAKRPLITAFAASTSCITAGQPVVLNWEVNNPKHCSLATSTDVLKTALPVRNGSLTVNPSQTGDYILNCRQAKRQESKTVSIFVQQPNAQRQVTLTARYERLQSSAIGLSQAADPFLPIRAASFELLDVCNNAVVATGALSDQGSANLTIEGGNVVRLRVFSEITSPAIAVVDNTHGQALYALETTGIDLAKTGTIEVSAVSGWGTEQYNHVRAAGPFAILDTTYKATLAIAAVTQVTFPPLTINWSVKNYPQDGDYAEGAIGTSFWDGEQLYILGQADVDTDEFDEHVIVHEWGHFFESVFSRADTLGGNHSFGELLDSRVAFSEGWANALSGIILYPDVIYIDTFGDAAAKVSGFDLDDNSEKFDPRPGWFSEASVQAILFDLFDDNQKKPESWDDAALGLGPIIHVLMGYQVETSAFTTIFSLISGLKQHNPASITDINQLTTKHQIAHVIDDYGSSESNAGLVYPEGGGVASNLPVYRTATVPGLMNLTFAGGDFAADGNKLGQHRYVKFWGTGQAITIQAEAMADIGLFLYERGKLVGAADFTLSGVEELTFSSKAGVLYILDVTGFRTQPGAYSATVTLQQ